LIAALVVGLALGTAPLVVATHEAPPFVIKNPGKEFNVKMLGFTNEDGWNDLLAEYLGSSR
jgi:hypothetical protein